jgi:hypothetical protein
MFVRCSIRRVFLVLTDTEALLIARGFGPEDVHEKLKRSGHAER